MTSSVGHTQGADLGLERGFLGCYGRLRGHTSEIVEAFMSNVLGSVPCSVCNLQYCTIRAAA